MTASRFFGEQEREDVARAIREVEASTAGEVVAMVVNKSWTYPRAEFLGGIFLTLMGTLLVSLVVPLGSAETVILAQVPLFLGFLALIRTVPPLKKLFIAKGFLRECVRERAIRAFHELGLDRTREGTGVLIMISLFEHDVEILADRGINDRVAPGTWDAAVGVIVQGIRDHRPAEALIDAIRDIGLILATEFPLEPDDVNELHDHLIIDES